MILQLTTAGQELETRILTQGGEMPKIAHLAVGDGECPEDMSQMTQLTHETYRSDILVKDQLSSHAVKLHGEVPPDVETRITQIGLVLADGTLYAVGGYQPEVGGFFKAAGFAFSFFVILSKEQAGELAFEYNPVDIQAMALKISQEAKVSVDLFIQSYFINLLMLCSGMSADIARIKKHLHKLETMITNK